MQRITRFRQVLVVAGVASLMLATTVSAGASFDFGQVQRRGRQARAVGLQGHDLAGRDRRDVRAGRVHGR